MKYSNESNVNVLSQMAVKNNDIRYCENALYSHTDDREGITCYINYFKNMAESTTFGSFDKQFKVMSEECQLLDPNVDHYCYAAAAQASGDALLEDFKHNVNIENPGNNIRIILSGWGSGFGVKVQGVTSKDVNTVIERLVEILKENNYFDESDVSISTFITDNVRRNIYVQKKNECVIRNSYFHYYNNRALLQIDHSTKTNSYSIGFSGNLPWFACEREDIYKMFNEILIPHLKSQ